jgi:hypothetical protein
MVSFTLLQLYPQHPIPLHGKMGAGVRLAGNGGYETIDVLAENRIVYELEPVTKAVRVLNMPQCNSNHYKSHSPLAMKSDYPKTNCLSYDVV